MNCIIKEEMKTYKTNIFKANSLRKEERKPIFKSMNKKKKEHRFEGKFFRKRDSQNIRSFHASILPGELSQESEIEEELKIRFSSRRISFVIQERNKR